MMVSLIIFYRVSKLSVIINFPPKFLFINISSLINPNV